jgi:ABC-type polysaccharide/polyol phosphate transport system ATPase subunit
VNAITVRNLGKKFKLFNSPGGRFLEYLSMGRATRHTDFWALQDITFEVPQGTTLGIVGQNGSGKSTLLSILAGVLEPSAGSFEINGKVSAILELGSGFHPEFSGRDNVYMYGSIMGLSKEEIDGRFKDIVRFSELGDFIDQPLRTYSSGMIVRLAFSVAVNVNADILIVDEALAVGDAIFQHRCFRKIRELQEAGKTILYVGHDTEAVRNLCTSALLLDGGRIIERGDPNTVVNKYYALITERERTYSEGNLIEHGEMPSEGYETVYDFVQNLSEANIVSAKGVSVQAQTVEVNSSPRRVIFAHPPSQIVYRVRIELGSSLAFAIGILPAAWDKMPQGVKFDIDILSDGKTDTIFSRVLQPKRNIGDRGWHNFIVLLEKFSEKTVSMQFSTSGSEEDLSYCWAAWGWIKLIQLNPADVKSIKVNNHYEFNISKENLSEKEPCQTRYGNKKAEIKSVELLNFEGNSALSFKTGENAIIKIIILSHQDFNEDLTVGCTIRNKHTTLYGMNTRWKNCDLKNLKQGNVSIVKISFCVLLGAGYYSLTPAVAIVHSDFDIEVLDRTEDYMIFQVQNDQKMEGIIDLNAELEAE